MRVLAIIPARGGSKRLPGKNVAMIAGRPLIAWTISAAKSVCKAGVWVSTEDGEISRIAMAHGARCVERPKELASDKARTEPVIEHALKRIGVECDAVAVLQPTSPLRTAIDIHRAVDVMARSGADSVISVCAIEDASAVLRIGHADRLHPASFGQTLYAPNGAIYLLTPDLIKSGGDWYGVGAYAYVMPPERSIDIDTQADFDSVRRIWEKAS